MVMLMTQMKTRKMTQNLTRNNREKKENYPEKICKTKRIIIVMAVGMKKKKEIDKK